MKKMLLLCLILTSMAFCEKVVITEGSLSVGKFYKSSIEPFSPFEDELATKYSTGSKLTDERLFSPPSIDAIVGFKGKKDVDIVVDLGKRYSIKSIKVHFVQSEELLLSYPKAIEASIANDNTDQTKWAKIGSAAGEDIAQDGWAMIECEKKARFVKYTINLGGKNVGIDEVDICGTIENRWRYAPEKGCYHGAFPPAYGFSKEMRQGKGGMMLDTFEELVGKRVAMVLWYQGMWPGIQYNHKTPRNFAEIQKWRADYLGKNYDGHRLMMFGWLPKINSKRIAEGEFDEFFIEYFSDSVNPDKLDGIDDPLFFRPLNEFNSTWVPWGLDPYNLKRAWRRMYNIAEQIGAAQKHIFVWAPNHRSYPDEPWNNMDEYYPGDQYVDWVGLSAYPPSLKFVGTEDARYPKARLKEFYDLYADKKPLMIAEGGFSNTTDPVRWVKEWFESIKNDYPSIKAFIWENHNDRVIQSSDEALELYRDYIQDDYWLDTWK